MHQRQRTAGVLHCRLRSAGSRCTAGRTPGGYPGRRLVSRPERLSDRVRDPCCSCAEVPDHRGVLRMSAAVLPRAALADHRGHRRFAGHRRPARPGACPPLSPDLPDRERQRVLHVSEQSAELALKILNPLMHSLPEAVTRTRRPSMKSHAAGYSLKPVPGARRPTTVARFGLQARTRVTRRATESW